jgi:hypothetical protein
VIKLVREDKVIFDSIPGPQNHGLLESWYRADDLFLDIEGKAGGDTVGIKLVDIESFRFDKDMVGGAVGKFDDLVLDGWTIPWTDPVNLPAVEGGAVKIGFDDLPGFFRGRCQKTGFLGPVEKKGVGR